MDRLDYTKGLVNRFKAFEKLLLLYPEFLERVMLLQVLGYQYVRNNKSYIF